MECNFRCQSPEVELCGLTLYVLSRAASSLLQHAISTAYNSVILVENVKVAAVPDWAKMKLDIVNTVSVCPVLISLSTKGSAWLFSNTTPVRCPYWSCALSIYFYIRAVNLAAPIPFSGKGIAITRKEENKKAAAANAISLEIKVVGSRWFHNQRTASGLDVLSRSFQKALILIVRWSHAPIQSTHMSSDTRHR